MSSAKVLNFGPPKTVVPDKPGDLPSPALAKFLPVDDFSKDDKLAEYPHTLSSDLCWGSNSFPRGPKDYVVQLTPEEVRHVSEAITAFKALNLENIALVSRENFRLPSPLAKKLRDISDEVHNGRGFVVIRGLKAKQCTCSDEDGVIAFLGVMSYIGDVRCANSNGMAMDHLRDAIRDEKPKGREHVELHPSKMMAPLKFHADRKFADILALFVKSKAASGGKQYLSSAWTVYNKMRESYPEDLRILVNEFPWPGVKDDQPHTTYSPVFFYKDGRIICQLVYRIFEGTNILNSRQWHALDVLEEVANGVAIELDVREGDIQVINNLGLLHARRGWIDRPGKERYYYRLGLRDTEHGWPRPDNYETVFDDRYGVVPEDQIIPITDFDPYGLTSLDDSGHG
ncbi:hypothetical protein QBC40DRAFT_277680 [Triangularia verruculosa]|uniref:TauD/TfdA-like domain-containing protein n=1 Tax=Triangularia verruculosa TaxID=2587418 RepID=A0AAN6XJW4_9PEZI|nr:hypothetical protein QBC40DRAFT_277680 [Triangularia verruculosa]